MDKKRLFLGLGLVATLVTLLTCSTLFVTPSARGQDDYYWQVWQLSDDPSGAPTGYSEWNYYPSTTQWYECDDWYSDLEDCTLRNSTPPNDYMDEGWYLTNYTGKFTYDWPSDPKYEWYSGYTWDFDGLGSCHYEYPVGCGYELDNEENDDQFFRMHRKEFPPGYYPDNYCESSMWHTDETYNVNVAHTRVGVSGAWHKEDPVKFRWAVFYGVVPTPTEPNP